MYSRRVACTYHISPSVFKHKVCHPHSESLPSANAKPCIPGSVLFKAFLFFPLLLSWHGSGNGEQTFGAPGRTKSMLFFDIIFKHLRPSMLYCIYACVFVRVYIYTFMYIIYIYKFMYTYNIYIYTYLCIHIGNIYIYTTIIYNYIYYESFIIYYILSSQ